MLGSNKLNEQKIKITGDGNCALYPVAVTLCAAILDNRRFLNQEKALNFDRFLKRFAEFHPNFKPATFDNFVQWVKHYATTKRDMELLVGPVLRHWYMYQVEGLPTDVSLAKLAKAREHHLGDEALDFVCEQFGFNLKKTESGLTWNAIEGNQGPCVHVVHGTEHFDLRLDGKLANHVKENDSHILARNASKVENAWDPHFAPLPEPSLAQTRKTAAPVLPAFERARNAPHFNSDAAYALRLAQQEREDLEYTKRLVLEGQKDFNLAHNLHKQEEDDFQLAQQLEREEQETAQQVERDRTFARNFH